MFSLAVWALTVNVMIVCIYCVFYAGFVFYDTLLVNFTIFFYNINHLFVIYN